MCIRSYARLYVPTRNSFIKIIFYIASATKYHTKSNIRKINTKLAQKTYLCTKIKINPKTSQMARNSKFSSPEENPEDKKIKLNKQNFQKTVKLFRFALPYKNYFIIGMMFLVLSTLTTLSFPKLAGTLTDVADGKSNAVLVTISTFCKNLGVTNPINQVALIFFGILVLQAMASFFRVYLFAIVTEKTMADIRSKLYAKIITLPLSFFEKNRVGELVSRMNTDVAQLESMLSFNLAELFRQMAVLLIGITLILISYPKLALVMLATFPLMIIAAIFFGKFIRKLSKKTQDLLAQANTIVEETFQAINVVKAFTMELFEVKRYRKNLDEVVVVALKASVFRGAFVSFLIFALFGGIVFVLWYGATLIASGEMKTGELVEFILYMIFIGASVAGMGDLYAQLQRTVGASERILEILEEESEFVLEENIAINSTEKTTQKAINSIVAGNIVFKNVQFSYPTRTDVQVLKSINFEILAGQKIALVGHSGAGKSTIAQLLMKFYKLESTNGQISIDNQNINDINTPYLRQNIGIVPQEVILFGGTIKENISYGKLTATDAEIIEAARQANALDFIEGFPEKFETIVGERGIKLSGGQRQRIAIARAILKNPRILVLDEATSSLDAESEKLVADALDNLMQNRTTIIIAHRLATIRKVDKIYVLSNGNIMEQGTHDELFAQNEGIYNNLVRLQLEMN